MQNELHQWAAAYLTSADQGEPFLFGKMREIIRNQQNQGKLKEIIFSQLFMIIQTMKVMGKIPEGAFQVRVKKLLAILYNDNFYLSKLVEQVTEISGQTQQHVQAQTQPVKRGPPASQSIC